MEKIIKQSAGIDCAKKDFTVTFSVCDEQQEVKHLSSRTFKNEELGYKSFNKWLGKLQKRSISLILVMEATGVYHEKLACFLSDLGYSVAVVLPKRAKDFSKTLTIKKVTDKIASESLATMGLEKKLSLWKKPLQLYRDIKHLTREKEQIQGQITQIKNQLEAETQGAWVNENTIKRLNATLKLLKDQKKEVQQEIKQVVESNEELKKKIEIITTIPGIGLITAATVIAETNGFSQVRNKRQLVSYAGYDVINQQSGTSVWTKPRISKRGNKHIRKAMHMPALSSIRNGGNSKDVFVRLVSKSGVKMKGVVAVQRKLLVLIYTLWKNNTNYEQNYEQKKRQLNAA